ncbi:hypothetical protein SASPL_136309 [Salvia splendens]|uniref:Uncharacterized protein n=1 Tax=Salvia splendens TaxID=180675 RepID=A0A8X8ZGI4_SALSN|nr:hypothetical protein SASPL_136309 [Salvia splendens]
MADKAISLDSIKAFWNSQVHNPDKWDHNVNVEKVSFSVQVDIALLRVQGPFCSLVHWLQNILLKLVRAAGIFAGSIVLMRQYGDMMGI